MITGITEQLALHTARVRFEDIPREAIEKAKDRILDQIGVELIGSTWSGTRLPIDTLSKWAAAAKAPWSTTAPKFRPGCGIRERTFGQGCVSTTSASQPAATRVPPFP